MAVFLLAFTSCSHAIPHKGFVRFSGTHTLDVKYKPALQHICVTKINGNQILATAFPKEKVILLHNLTDSTNKYFHYNTIDSGQDEPLDGIYVQSYDSLFLMFGNRIILTDTMQHIKIMKSINPMTDGMWQAKLYTNPEMQYPLFYDDKLKRLYFREICGTCAAYEEDFYRTPVEAYYELSKDTILDAPVFIPESYHNHYFGDADMAFRITNENENITSFMASPDFVVYDRVTGKSRRVSGPRSAFDKEHIKSIDTLSYDKVKDKIKHLTISPLYMKMLHDPYRHVYYRFFLSGVPAKNTDGTFNSFLDKQLIVMVLDEKFNLLTEQLLTTPYLNFYSFAGPKGLYILKNTSSKKILDTKDEEHHLFFDIYSYSSH